MFSEQEFLRIMNTAGGLHAVKYMKNETGMPLADCKAFLDKCKSEGKNLVGTITWFKCEDQLPPQTGTSNTSMIVLVYCPNISPRIYEDFYLHDANIWWKRNKPTHWAYLNTPE
jgi:DNA-binding transcriptional MerR regulator